MIATILGGLRVAEIRKKILFTAGILALYRLGAHIPAPGINHSALNSIQQNLGGNSILGLLNLFSGGGLGRIAIFALGYAAFITTRTLLFGIDTPGYASIIVSVLFLGGVQLISLGILGEYVGRVLTETKQRPLYVVRYTIGLASRSDPLPHSL